MNKTIEKVLKEGAIIKGGDGFLTPKGRVLFHSVFKAQENKIQPEKKAKYNIVLLFDKNETDITTLKKWTEDIIHRSFKATDRASVRNPIKDADKDGKASKYEVFQNCYYINANTGEAYPPVVRNEKNHDITEEDRQFYQGCYARVALTAYAYNVPGNKGLSYNLGAVQKIDDGPRFSDARVDADSVFAPVIELDNSLAEEEDTNKISNPFVNTENS